MEKKGGASTGDVGREARALSAPTRRRILEIVAESPEPVSVATLTDALGFNHNAIRQHLVILRDAGLVREMVEERTVPGRPRLLYRAEPAARGRLGGPGPYAWLATLLSVAVRRRLDPREVGRREGRRLAARQDASREPLERLEGELARQGFQPEREERGRRVELVLRRCPFVEVAASDPATICQLHRGLAEGLAEGVGGVVVERLVAKDPRTAGCRLRLEVEATRAGPGSAARRSARGDEVVSG